MVTISPNRRFLMDEDGKPFFYLADTAWALLQRLDRADTEDYLRDRAGKGFTAIQAVALSEFDGLRVPNHAGDLPLHDEDPAKPNEAYFAHVDWVVARANELGMIVALLPTWGDKVGPVEWGTGPVVFDQHNAHSYGRFLGERYRDRATIWVLGGDRTPTTDEHRAIWDAMAAGIAEGDGGRHLKTYHPKGLASSSTFFHDEPWLDFNMLQSGHAERDFPNHRMIEQDYARQPAKPCLDGEPCYEDHPVDWKPRLGYFDAHDARMAAYRAVFAGAMGHTYGANGIFQFHQSGPDERFGARRSWREALALPGAGQMQHLRRLIEQHTDFERVPDQGLLGAQADSNDLRATRAIDGSYALVYSARGEGFTVERTRLRAGQFDACWFDPREGVYSPSVRLQRDEIGAWTPPSHGPDQDWVLLLRAVA